VPRFEPFRGIRYAPDVDLAAVLAPPYDVIDAEGRARLEARDARNAVRVELPVEGDDGTDRYTAAGCLFDEWLASGVLVQDDEPSFYVYRMGYHDAEGRARQTAGVVGALELSAPGEADVLPHERTMSKPKDDRLRILRSCRANLSPVWCLSLAEGLGSLCELPGGPDMRATDEDGVHHRLWRVAQAGVVDAIRDAVASQPVVIADGHHRYETAIAFREEVRAAHGGTGGDADLLMTFVVELAEEQLTVRPIHRLLHAVGDGVELPDALDRWFEPFETDAAVETLPDRMIDAGALALVVPGGAWLLRPRDPRPGEPDSRLLDGVLDELGAEVTFHHDAAQVAALVGKGEARAGILLRPPTVAQIAAAARARLRMPEKTTFFHPKPRTGLVFRRLDLPA
jgi:uncharacterized protein (DUF1015 family)